MWAKGKGGGDRKSGGKTAGMMGKDVAALWLQIAGITAAIAWLCYDSPWGILWIFLVAPVWMRRFRRARRRADTARKQQEFKELLLMVSTSIQAGYSVENAFVEAERELREMFGNESVLCPALHEVNAGVGVSVPLEKGFAEFAERLGLEDGDSFSQIFSFAKRTGGDYGKNIRRTALKIEEKIGTGQEIETILAEKRLELGIMSWMPPGIILYVRLTSGGFMASLYHNTVGILVMSGCLVAYGALLLLGERLVEIEV